MTFHVGQKVVCVDADSDAINGMPWPIEVGRVYTVRSVGMAFGCNPWGRETSLCLELEGTPNPHYYGGDWYDARRFRPAVQPRKELPESITKYLNVPGRVDA